MATKTFSAGGAKLESTITTKLLANGMVQASSPTLSSASFAFQIKGIPAGAQITGASFTARMSFSGSGRATMNGKACSAVTTVGVAAYKSQVRNGARVAASVTARATPPSGTPSAATVKHVYRVTISSVTLTVTYTGGSSGSTADPEYGHGVQSPFIGPGKTVIVPGRQSAHVHVYPENCADFSMNGPLILRPSQADITGEDNGDFSAEILLPMDPDKKWMGLVNRAILRMPAPARKSLEVNYTRGASSALTARNDDLLIYTAQHSRGHVPMYSAPSSSDAGKQKQRKLLLNVKNGRTLYLLGSDEGANNTTWYNMATDRGVSGWVLSTEVQAQAGASAQVKDVNAEQTRDQLFRIYDVTEKSEGLQVSVKARHIFYDLLKVIVMTPEKMTNVPAAQALQMLLSYADHATPFRIATDCTGTVSGDFRGQNVVSALLEPEKGIAAQLGAHVVRDNFDIYVIQDIAADRGVRVQHERNLQGATAHKSSDGMFNRIIAKIGDTTTTVDDPERPEDAEILTVYRTYNADDGTAQEQAAKEFREGLSAQDFSLDVDFVLLSETARFGQYNGMQRLFLGDSCAVSLPWAQYEAAMTAYVWSAITRRYKKVTVGATAAREMIGSVSSYQIRGMGASKLLGQIVSDQVGDQAIRTRHLAASSVTSEKIEAGAITAAKIAAGSVTAEKIGAQAVTAEKLNAGAVTADKLSAGAVTTEKIAASAIDALYAGLATANISWANIQTLQAAVADLADARIAGAEIDWAQIKDLVSRRAIITQGEAGEMYIARLAVTEANLLSLTVGEIMVRGADGGFYALTVDGEGNVSAARKQVQNADVQDGAIDGGEKLMAGSVTARALNAQEIFGDNAMIRHLIAESLDVDTLFAREAVISRLNALDITGNDSIRLYVQHQDQMNAYLRVTENGLEIGRVGDTARFRADNRTLDVTNVKTERLGITQQMGMPDEWAWIATKTGLGLKYLG